MIGIEIEAKDVGSTIEVELVAVRVRDVIVRVTQLYRDSTRTVLAAKMVLAAGDRVAVGRKDNPVPLPPLPRQTKDQPGFIPSDQ